MPSKQIDERASLKIACYGYAERDAGSVSSAGYVVLQELIDRGYLIDFFGKRCFAFPSGLEKCPNFRFVDAEGAAERYFGTHSNRGPKPLRRVAGILTANETYKNVHSAILVEHKRRHYDLCLFLGTWAFGKTPSLRTISWVQGPPGTDSRSIARHAGTIRQLEGFFRFAALRGYAAYRDTFGLPPFDNTDVVICGSVWASEELRQYVATGIDIVSLPYPVDLERFTPFQSPVTASAKRPIILWAGRSVPRKRLDLFLDACSRLIRTGRDIDVRIVGGFGFAPGYRRLIDQFPFPDRLEYMQGVPREQMPDIYRNATVLVQPSEDENFGSAVAEALACGTPVVVGPTNGTADYIADAGVRFDRYETESVAAAIIKVLEMSNIDKQGWSIRARTAAEHFFDVRSVVDALEKQFQLKIYGVARSESFEANVL